MKLDGATTLIVVSPEDLEYPEYKIENRTKDNIVLQQKGCEHSDFLPAEGTLPYAWDDPSARNKTLLLQFENTNEVSLDIYLVITSRRSQYFHLFWVFFDTDLRNIFGKNVRYNLDHQRD